MIFTDQAKKLEDLKKKEQSSVHLRPFPSISIKINPDYTFFPYLYRIDKGTPLPSYLVLTNS